MRKIKLTLLLTGCCILSFGQDIVFMEPFDNSFRSKKTYYKQPSELVEILIKDKTTEYEKFKSIFYWVINNIDYDYWSYLSKRGRPSSSIRDILKHRVALCGDYANLMDTLCFMAGIQSPRVDGYVKDENFDVHDSIYISNHAWNIVRLDNLWYPYDITWSKGALGWHYTKFSQWIVNQKKKLKYTVDSAEVKFTSNKHYGYTECPDQTPKDQGKEVSIFLYKYKYKQKLRRWILNRFRIRIKLGFKESKSLNYFLSEPEIFHITHSPEDPSYSLIRTQTFREFESDSNYYHLSPLHYAQQKRNGRACHECIMASAGTQLEKAIRLKNNTLSYNRKNKFTPAHCDFSIATALFEESLVIQDSTVKIRLLDTTLSILEESKSYMALGAGAIRSEYDQQKQKNRKKLNNLLDSANANRRFIRGQIQRVSTETKEIKNLENGLQVDLRAYLSRKRTLANFKISTKIEQDNKKVQRTIDFLLAELVKNNHAIDSLNTLIESNRLLFSEWVPVLYNRIRQRLKEQDSLSAPLERRMHLRGYFYDDYKKPVVVQSDSLRNRKLRFSENLDSLLMEPSRLISAAGKKISGLIRERNQQRLIGYRIHYQLFAFKTLTPLQFDSYLQLMRTENDNDICWIKGNSNGLPALFYGFKAMNFKSKDCEQDVSMEIACERTRYSAVEKELKRRRQQRLSIASNNRRVVVMKARAVKRNKSEFLKQLREQRREERISNKNNS